MIRRRSHHQTTERTETSQRGDVQLPSTDDACKRAPFADHTIVCRSLREAIRLGYIACWARTDQLRQWPAWAFIATSGDRRGANLGARWSDIDLDRGTAQLIWTVTAGEHVIVVKPSGRTGVPREFIRAQHRYNRCHPDTPIPVINVHA